MSDDRIPLEANSEYEITARVSEVLIHTEVIATPTADFVLSPGQVWVVEKPRPEAITWEVQLPEEDFWRIAETFLGPAEVLEMKADLADMLRWEGEGGTCLT